MQCPKCNTEIPEGLLYCPECGEEIIIVSDFDIQLENNIDISTIAKTAQIPDLSGVTKELDNLDTKEINLEKDIDDSKVKKNSIIGFKIPKFYIFLGLILSVAVIIGLIYGIKTFSDYSSYDVQYSKANGYYSESDYNRALKTVKHAISIDRQEIKGYVLMADIYCAQNNYDAAIAVLVGVLNDNPGIVALYDRIVKCYELEGDYESIRFLLDSTDDKDIMARYPDYYPQAPSFSFDSGKYIEPGSLVLSAIGDGDIYYTTDGSEPTKDSLLYREGIPLEEGETIVSAFFINSKGISSDIVTKDYFVENDLPDIPVMLTSSGSYNIPNPIGVNKVPDVTYYYVRGNKTPTEEDELYEVPLFMPFGNSQYTFIAQNEHGEYSESITVDYDFSFAASIDKQVAEYAISYHLLTTGDTVFGYTYVSTSGYTKDAVSYYIVDEINGTKKTGRIFAVDSTTGALYKVSVDKENCTYSFTPM